MIARLILSLLVFLVVSVSSLAAQPSEYEVKAGFVLNFLKLVTFSSKDTDLSLCIAGNDNIFKPFKLLEGTEVEARRVEVVRYNRNNSKYCQVVFVGKGFRNQKQQVLDRVMGQGTLSIGESESFTLNGGIIRFYFKGTSIRFEINTKGAEREGLTISSRLLRLAKLVDYG